MNLFKFIICPDVNFRVWNASEFNKSKILFEECSRCSLLHIQKICVKRYMKCLYFSLKLIGLPGCSIRFWKSKKGKNSKNSIPSLPSINIIFQHPFLERRGMVGRHAFRMLSWVVIPRRILLSLRYLKTNHANPFLFYVPTFRCNQNNGMA